MIGGTVVRFETPDAISRVSLRLTDVALGGRQHFRRELREGMRQTLERIRAEAEER